jgi:hypothetical protein
MTQLTIRSTMRLKNIIVLLVLLIIVITCDSNPFHSDKDEQLIPNGAPETHLFLITTPDSLAEKPYGIDTTVSKQTLYWWGEDKDGQVIGYYYKWDYEDTMTWTTAETKTFYVPIRTNYDEFTFSVWAVDNDSLIDPSPAIQTFPVFNSFPSIAFKNRSNPPAPANKPNVTAYTFPTRTFFWDVEDADGVETIQAVYYALDDSTDWQQLEGDERSITLTNLTVGEHRFFVKAEDIAGAQSNIISFPDPNDDTTPNTWAVREPVGDVLLINDFALDQSTHEVQSIYETALTEIVGANGYSVWEIGTNSVPAINPENILPYSSKDILANLNYFKKVIWFSHLGQPHLSEAGLSLTQYVGKGGFVFITNGNETQPDTSWTFTKIDSTYILNPKGRLLKGVDIWASFSDDEIKNSSVDLTTGKLVGNRVSALVPGPGTEAVYKMQHDTTATVAVPYTGSPAVGLRYPIGQGESIYFSLPLHYCDGRGNFTDLLRYIIEEEFNK